MCMRALAMGGEIAVNFREGHREACAGRRWAQETREKGPPARRGGA